MSINRLTADEFIEQIKSAEDWILVHLPYGEVALVTILGEEKTRVYGPDPHDMSYHEQQTFLARVERVARKREVSKMPDTANPLNRIDAELFIQKMKDAPKWLLYQNEQQVLTLCIPTEDDAEIYHEPNMLDMNYVDYLDFLFRVRQIAEPEDEVPEVRRK